MTIEEFAHQLMEFLFLQDRAEILVLADSVEMNGYIRSMLLCKYGNDKDAEIESAIANLKY